MRRAQWSALGLTDEDLEKPKIAIVNSSSQLASCFSHLDGMVCLASCDKTTPGQLGLRGAPGMGLTSALMFAIDGAGLSAKVARGATLGGGRD